jgi:glycosyltransferase involved in cell wall biosynthesis
MPTYNRAGFIMDTIESIRRQTYTYWELIIADDGSADDTKQQVEGLNDPRIIYLQYEHTGKGSRMKNLALRKSSGELVAFIDSDDLWDPSKLEKQVEALNRFPTAGFCVTNGYNFSKPGLALDHFYKQKQGYRFGQLFIAYFQSELSGFTQALLVRKNCLVSIGGFNEEKSFSDVDCIIALAYKYAGLILYEPLIYRRLHDSNHSDWSSDKNYDEGISLLQRNESRLPVSVYNHALFRLHINLGEKFFRQGIRRKAVESFVTAWKYSPFSIIPLRKVAKVFLRHQAFLQTIP